MDDVWARLRLSSGETHSEREALLPNVVSVAVDEAEAAEDKPVVSDGKYTQKPHIAVSILILAQTLSSYSECALVAIMAVFLHDNLGYSDRVAGAITNVLVCAYSAMGMLGGLVSDMYLGRVYTTIYGSIVSSVGYILVYTAWNHDTLLLGFAFVACGGVSMPTVSALVGDQYIPMQRRLYAHSLDDGAIEEEISHAYRRFYLWAINVGAIAGVCIGPWLPYQTSFMVNLVVSVLSTTVFILGDYFDTFTTVHEHVNVSRMKLIFAGHKTAFKHLAIVFAPLPIFWALFYNIPSLWTFTARRMRRNIAWYTIPAASVGALNPLLDTILLPVFDSAVYPFIKSRGYNFGPSRRMIIGMLCASLSFFTAAVVDYWGASLHVAWLIPQHTLLACGEILLVVTCLEYAYTNAPDDTKTLVMAGYYSTESIGNILVALANGVQVGTLAQHYAFFGAFMFVFMLWYERLTHAWSVLPPITSS